MFAYLELQFPARVHCFVVVVGARVTLVLSFCLWEREREGERRTGREGSRG